MSLRPGRVAMPRATISFAILLAMACGSGNGGDPGGRPDASAERPDGRERDPDGGQPGSDGGHPGSDGGQPGSRDAGADWDASVPAVAYCQRACTSPADCNFGSAPYDSNNYDCQNDTCVYTGCNDDAECQALRRDDLCRTSPGNAVPSCLPGCATPGDCSQGSPPFDSNNYDCQNSVCVYTGCNDDAECRALGNYVCRTLPGSIVPSCQRTCTTADDCNLGSAPYDSDNYDCQNDVCVYTGCNDDAECQTQGNYVCSSGG